jgi:Holliday junction resolvasome RuvABC DNA-binding subunit
VNLGYQRPAAGKAVDAVLSEHRDATVEQCLREALRVLTR